MHANHVSYNRFLDQVVIDVKAFNEFIVVDHSTTIEAAKGSTGGKCGKGGDILYRWGNPSNYGMSDTDSSMASIAVYGFRIHSPVQISLFPEQVT